MRMLSLTGARNTGDPRRNGRLKHGRALKDRVPAYKSEWYHANKRRLQVEMRAGHLRRNYGMTESDFDTMKEKQGGRCAICERLKRLCIDHDHNTGIVRGLLCYACNGQLHLMENFLPQAQRYLSKYA